MFRQIARECRWYHSGPLTAEWLVPLPIGATHAFQAKAARFYSSTDQRGLDLSSHATVRAVLKLRPSQRSNEDV